ncbi:YgaP family membrane protein [Aquirufa sp. ROCK2-A2]
MEKNIGRRDRVFRYSIAIILGILTYSRIIPSELAIPVYIIAVIIALTGLSRICLLYKPFGISTCREK